MSDGSGRLEHELEHGPRISQRNISRLITRRRASHALAIRAGPMDEEHSLPPIEFDIDGREHGIAKLGALEIAFENNAVGLIDPS